MIFRRLRSFSSEILLNVFFNSQYLRFLHCSFNIYCFNAAPMFPYRLRLLLIFLSFLLVRTIGHSQDFIVYDSLPQLEERVRQNDDNTTLVINFWATWCKPCVEELPSFDELSQQYAGQNVQVLLVSLDFKSKLQTGFIPFLKAHRLQSEVILFADQDANNWIPRIHEAWDGAIPATIVLRGSTKMFHTGKFEHYDDLETFVQPFLSVIDAPSPRVMSSPVPAVVVSSKN